jgi:hypothetical protein
MRKWRVGLAPAECRKREALLMRLCVFHSSIDSVGQPHLYDRLAGDSNAGSFNVQRIDHPGRKIDIHASNIPTRPTCAVEIKMLDYVLLVVID